MCELRPLASMGSMNACVFYCQVVEQCVVFVILSVALECELVVGQKGGKVLAAVWMTTTYYGLALLCFISCSLTVVVDCTC